MSYLELKDRVELSSIYADTSDMSTTGFYQNNNSLTGSIDKTYLNPLFLTNTSYIYIYGINQQTNKEVSEKWNNFLTVNSINFGTGSDWNYGYYKIEVRQYDTNISDTTGKWVVLNKKPIYWNKSPLRFMTYVNSGSFEIGCPYDEVGNENHNVATRKLITISKPFFIGRTLVTCDLFNNVVNTISSSIYNTYYFRQKINNNSPKASIIYNRYSYDGKYYIRNNSFQLTSVYPTETNLNSLQNNYVYNWAWVGGSASTYIPTQQSLNECPCYLVNSIGYTDSTKTTPVYATKSFCEHYMDLGYTTNNSNCILNGQGWHWSIPTECQWEYACRAGTSTAFNNGVNLKNSYPSTITTANANILQQNINEIAWGTNHSGSILWSETNMNVFYNTGILKSNKLGLFDMHGYFYEWCLDEYQNDFYDSINNTSDRYAGSPINNKNEKHTYIWRGGSIINRSNIYTQYARGLRSAFRGNWNGSEAPSLYTSFRLVLLQP